MPGLYDISSNANVSVSNTTGLYIGGNAISVLTSAQQLLTLLDNNGNVNFALDPITNNQTVYAYFLGNTSGNGGGSSYSNVQVAAFLPTYTGTLNPSAIYTNGYYFANGQPLSTGVSGNIWINGDITAHGTTGQVTNSTLSTTGVTAGTYGADNLIPIITVDSKGRITYMSVVGAAGGTYGNANVTALLTGTVNVGNLITTRGIYWANGVAYSSGGTTSSYGNANVAAYLPTDSTIIAIQGNIATLNANLGAYETWANASIASINANVTAANLAIGSLQSNAAVQETEISELRANITAANVNIATLNANVGAYETWANASIASTNANVTAANAAIVTANTGMKSYVDGQISTVNTSINTINANLGAYETYANANAASQATSINTINANLGAYQTYANTSINTINANLGSFQTYANIHFGDSNYGNANVAAYLPTDPTFTGYLTFANANAATQATSINTINANLGAYQTYANATFATQATTNTINANLGAYQTYANTSINTINANLGAYQTYANANLATQTTNFNTLNANVGAYETWANIQFTNSYSNTNVIALVSNVNNKLGYFGQSLALSDAFGYTGAQVTTTNSADLFLGSNANVANSGVIFAGNVIKSSNGNVSIRLNYNGITGQVNMPGNVFVGNVVSTGGYFWANGAVYTPTVTSSYGNANVAAYLPTYTGAIGNLTSGSAVQIRSNAQVILDTGATSISLGINQIDISTPTGALGKINITSNVNMYGLGQGYLTVGNTATVGNLITTNGVYWANGAAYSSGSGSSFTGNLAGSTIYDGVNNRIFANAYPLSTPAATWSGNVFTNQIAVKPTYTGTNTLQPPSTGNQIGQVVGEIVSGNIGYQSRYGTQTSSQSLMGYLQSWPVTANTMNANDRIRAVQGINEVNLNGTTWGVMNTTSNTAVTLVGTGGLSQIVGSGQTATAIGALGAVIVIPVTGSANIQYATNFMATTSYNATNAYTASNIAYARMLGGTLQQTGNLTITNAVGLHTTTGWATATNKYAVLNEDAGSVIQSAGNIVANTGAYFVGDGTYLVNLPVQTGTYSNTNVAAYLPTYNANIGSSYSTPGVVIQSGTVEANTLKSHSSIKLYDGTSTAFTSLTNDTNIFRIFGANGDPTFGYSFNGTTIVLPNQVGAAVNYANGVNILSTVTGTYSNTNVAAYLTGSITVGNIKSTSGYFWANGVNYSTTVPGTYTNSNVTNLLSGGTYGGDINAPTGVVTAAAINSTGASTATTYIQAGQGLYSIDAFSGTYSDGIVVDYVTGNGRISVGTNDAISFYTGGVGTTPTAVIYPNGNLVAVGSITTTNGVFWANGTAYSTGGGGSYGNTQVAAYLPISTVNFGGNLDNTLGNGGNITMFANSSIIDAHTTVGAFVLPTGGNTARPNVPPGAIRYNSDTYNPEWFTGNSWVAFGGNTYVPPPSGITITYLVVAGGGGAGASDGGGGGAGGYLTGTASLTAATPYTITVGGGGAGSSSNGSQGSNSSGFGQVAIGGGYGGAGGTGGNGGSGGGGGAGGSPRTGGSGTMGQGYNGGTGAAPTGVDYPAAGGGGAGAVGVDGATGVGGDGGVGAVNNITGTNVTYAGGGGGAVFTNAYTPGSGGVGGGGNGGAGAAGSNATFYGGGGGGGAGGGVAGGNGYGGAVIMKILTSSYTGSVTGGPSVATSGSYTIVTWSSSGSYTA